jgi:hypothetical protein
MEDAMRVPPVEITEESPAEIAACHGPLLGMSTDRNECSGAGQSNRRRGCVAGARVNEAARSEGTR